MKTYDQQQQEYQQIIARQQKALNGKQGKLLGDADSAYGSAEDLTSKTKETMSLWRSLFPVVPVISMDEDIIGDPEHEITHHLLLNDPEFSKGYSEEIFRYLNEKGYDIANNKAKEGEDLSSSCNKEEVVALLESLKSLTLGGQKRLHGMADQHSQYMLLVVRGYCQSVGIEFKDYVTQSTSRRLDKLEAEIEEKKILQQDLEEVRASKDQKPKEREKVVIKFAEKHIEGKFAGVSLNKQCDPEEAMMAMSGTISDSMMAEEALKIKKTDISHTDVKPQFVFSPIHLQLSQSVGDVFLPTEEDIISDEPIIREIDSYDKNTGNKIFLPEKDVSCTIKPKLDAQAEDFYMLITRFTWDKHGNLVKDNRPCNLTTINQQGKTFEVAAFTVHEGRSLKSGHYTAYKQMRDGKWYCYNNHHLTQVSDKNAHNAMKNAVQVRYVDASKPELKPEEPEQAINNTSGTTCWLNSLITLTSDSKQKNLTLSLLPEHVRTGEWFKDEQQKDALDIQRKKDLQEMELRQEALQLTIKQSHHISQKVKNDELKKEDSVEKSLSENDQASQEDKEPKSDLQKFLLALKQGNKENNEHLKQETKKHDPEMCQALHEIQVEYEKNIARLQKAQKEVEQKEEEKEPVQKAQEKAQEKAEQKVEQKVEVKEKEPKPKTHGRGIKESFVDGVKKMSTDVERAVGNTSIGKKLLEKTNKATSYLKKKTSNRSQSYVDREQKRKEAGPANDNSRF